MKAPTEFPVLFFVSQNGKPSIHVETFSTREAADVAFNLAVNYDKGLEYGANAKLRVTRLYKETK